MNVVTFFEHTELVAGVVAMLVTSGWSLIAWLQRRADRRADRIKEEIKTSSSGERTRLGRVEAEVKRLDERVTAVDAKVAQGFHEVEQRMSGFERELMTVARKDDLTEIKVAQARMDSRMGTLVESDRRFLEMLTGQGQSIGRIAAALGKGRDE